MRAMPTMILPVRRVLKEINDMISFLVSDSLIDDYNEPLVIVSLSCRLRIPFNIKTPPRYMTKMKSSDMLSTQDRYPSLYDSTMTFAQISKTQKDTRNPISRWDSTSIVEYPSLPG